MSDSNKTRMQQLGRQAISVSTVNVSVPIRGQTNCEHNRPISCIKGSSGNGILVVKAFGTESVVPIDHAAMPNDVQTSTLKDQELRLFHEREKKRSTEFSRQLKLKEEEVRRSLEYQKLRLVTVRRHYQGRGGRGERTVIILKAHTSSPPPNEGFAGPLQEGGGDEGGEIEGGAREEVMRGAADELLSMTFRGWQEVRTVIEENKDEGVERGGGGGDDQLKDEGEWEENEEVWEGEAEGEGEGGGSPLQTSIPSSVPVRPPCTPTRPSSSVDPLGPPLIPLGLHHPLNPSSLSSQPTAPPLALAPPPPSPLAPQQQPLPQSTSGPQLARMRLLAAAHPSRPSPHTNPPPTSDPHPPPPPGVPLMPPPPSLKAVHLNSFLPGALSSYHQPLASASASASASTFDPPFHQDKDQPPPPSASLTHNSSSLYQSNVSAAVLAATTSMRAIRSSRPHLHHQTQGSSTNAATSTTSSGLLLAGQWYKGRLLPSRVDCGDPEGVMRIGDKAREMGVSLPPLCACGHGCKGERGRERDLIHASYPYQCASNCPLFQRPRLYEKLVNDLLIERGVLQ